mmetsp:Transcript_79999/g.166358  ORF Transcript_79999/g.166358 Transcript_79999/m.166358 type:complete len:115 (+) Transcript_79999:385-729(+)
MPISGKAPQSRQLLQLSVHLSHGSMLGWIYVLMQSYIDQSLPPLRPHGLVGLFSSSPLGCLPLRTQRMEPAYLCQPLSPACLAPLPARPPACLPASTTWSRGTPRAYFHRSPPT